MSYRICLLSCILAGCFYVGKDTPTDIVQRPSSDWSSRDCLTVVLGAMQHNFFDDNSPNIKVVAMPYTPWVVMALNRMSQATRHWNEGKSSNELDTALADMCGLFYDVQLNRLVDHHGNYLRDPNQLDSLLFFLQLHNKSYPCAVPIVATPHRNVPLVKSPTDWPCYTPDITDLNSRIYLENDRGISLAPKYVWGRRHPLLGPAETLIIMFPLHASGRDMLKNTETVYLNLGGFDDEIRLAFPLKDIFPRVSGDSLQPTAVR